jgi:hypothetical protein
MGVLTVDLGSGEEALPVFSFGEEAELFLAGLVAPGEGWRVRRTAAGELISVLMGPCAGVGRVLLDPLPALTTGTAADLVGVDREDFLDLLLRGSADRRVANVSIGSLSTI